MSAWIGEGLGLDGGMHMDMRRGPKTDALKEQINKYRPQLPQYDAITWLGIGLAIGANMLIAVSLNIQKHAHNRNEALGDKRQPYHKIPLWLFGMVVNAVGEVGNLVAYGYAEASVVTPIGAVGVIASCIIATYVLKEPFTRMHSLGILLVTAGVVLIVYAKGNEKVIEHTVEEALEQYFLTPQSVTYFIILALLGFYLKVQSDRHGKEHVIYFVSLCSLIAAWTVLGSKCFMSFFRLTLEQGKNQLTRFPAGLFAWFMLVVIIVAAVGSLHFLQCAMMYHANNKVIPTYYATFTLSCIIAAAVVYREFEGLSFGKIMLFFVGLGLAGVGVFVLSSQDKPEEKKRDGDEEGADDKSDGSHSVVSLYDFDKDVELRERGFKEPCYLHFSPEAAGGDKKRIGSEGASHASQPDPEDDALEEIVVQGAAKCKGIKGDREPLIKAVKGGSANGHKHRGMGGDGNAGDPPE